MSNDQHAPLPPSGAPKWAECALNPTLEAEYPEDQEAEHEREGTAAHWVAEMRVNGIVDIAEGTLAENGYPVSAEMIDGADMLFDDVMRFWREGLRIWTEQPVAMPRVHPYKNWGTPDVFIIDHEQRVVRGWDYKFGHRYVDVVGNWQFLDYLEGIREWKNFGPDWSYVFTVVQPRCYHRDGPIRRWELTSDELNQRVEILAQAAARTEEPNPIARTGPWCGDCSGRHACEAFQRSAENGVDLAYRASHGELPPAAVATELYILRAAAARIKARIDGQEAHAEALIRSGKQVPGFSLEPKEGREKWIVPLETVIELGKIAGADLLKPPEPITPTQARKLLGFDGPVIPGYSERPRGKAELVMTDEHAVARIFKKAPQ